MGDFRRDGPLENTAPPRFLSSVKFDALGSAEPIGPCLQMATSHAKRSLSLESGEKSERKSGCIRARSCAMGVAYAVQTQTSTVVDLPVNDFLVGVLGDGDSSSSRLDSFSSLDCSVLPCITKCFLA